MNILKILKNNIRKYIRKYISVICTLLFIPIFSVNSYAINSLEGTFVNSWMLTTVDDGTRSMELVVQSSNAVLGTYSADYNNIYKYDNPAFSNVSYLTFGQSSQNFDFEYLPSIYDYYIAVRVHSNDVSSVSDFSYFPNNAYVRFYGLTSGSDFVNAYLQDISVEKYTDRDQIGFQLVGRIPSLESGLINMIRLISPAGSVPSNIEVEGLIIAFEKSSQSQTQSIVAAINSQTSSLGGKLDGIDSGIDKGNDLIENGNEDTQSALSDFNEVFEDFNNELDSLEQFDDDIIGEFNSANDNYKTELNNFNLAGSLLDASTWLSTSMQTVYDNSSDFKMLWLVPLLFGIPILLFVIKKDKEDN